MTSNNECYYCAEDNGKYCKICKQVICEKCHQENELTWHETEYLSPHQYYEMEFLGVKA